MGNLQYIGAGLLASALLVGAIGWSAPACAQKGDGDDQIESAGDEAKFRVIERFPESSDGERSLPGVDEDRPVLDDRVRDAVAQKDWAATRKLLEERSDGKDPYVRLLTGYALLEDGEHDDAFAIFESLEGHVDRLEDYRLFWAASAAFEREDYHRSALRAATVEPDSPLFGRALMLLSESLIEAGSTTDLEQAATTLELYLEKYPRGRSAKKARLELGRALEEGEDFDAAAIAYQDVRLEHPLTDEAKKAADRLEAIDKKLSDAVQKELEEPTNDGRMKRYRAMFAAHKSKVLVDELPDDIDRLDEEKEQRCEAIYLVAKSYSKLRKHTEGTPWYERILDECDATEYPIKALYVGGKGLWNAGERDRARRWFEQIWTDYADHTFADDAMYFSARILREEDRLDDAAGLLEDQVERYPDGDMAKDAHWLSVRQMFADEEYDEVIDYVDDLDRTGEDDLYTRGRLDYFAALAHQRLDQPDRAAEGYKRVIADEPLSYYALLALNRLGELDGVDRDDLCEADKGRFCDFISTESSPGVDIPDELRDTEAFERGTELIRLGLGSFAEAEFERLRGSSDDRDLWALSHLLDSARAYHLSHDLPRRHIDGWQDHYPEGGDDARWSLAYPKAFAPMVEQSAAERDLPPAIVWAIMREESGFNPRIESWANARGLLQLMKKTAQKVARDDGMGDITADDLFDPKVNVRLGTGYIEELAGKLDDHPALIIAGYNGGHANVRRWLDARGDEPLDLWVEDIPYGQTRKYTKRVLASFWTYAWLYGDDRVPAIDFELP